jgi:hypothetical protein
VNVSASASAGVVLHETSEDVLLDYGSGLNCWFSKVEYARLCAIKARPKSERGYGHEPCPLPKRVSQYSQSQKTFYAEIYGDAAAEIVFGVGPWLGRVRNATLAEQERKRRERKRREKQAI